MTDKTNPRGPRPLLTLQDTAALLGCSVKSLRRRIADRHIAVIRDGRLLRIDPDDLDKYIRSHRFG